MSTEMDRVRRIVDSMLFVSEGPVEITRIQELVGVEPGVLHDVITDLVAQSQERGVIVQRHGDAVQMVTAPEAAPYIEKLLGVQQGTKLSQPAVETLAIIAYRQPVTRAAIEAIRGVNVDRSIATLVNRGLIEEIGRLEAVGRPILYGTTFEFLQHFGLQSVSQLPPLDGNESIAPSLHDLNK